MNDFQTGVIKPIECVKEGFELIKSDYWILFAITFVAGLIGAFTLYILFGAMACGMFYCYLRKIDGGVVSFDDLWKGFGWWIPGFIIMLFILMPMILVYGIIYVPIIMAMVMGQNLSQGELTGLLVGAFSVDLIFIVIMVCFHTLLMFAFPLIVDRNLSAVKAMTTSARAVLKNMGGVVGLILVNFGLVLVGELAFCVGIYFVIPVLIAGNVVAYRKVFPRTASY
jgi:Predicted integral membrane protein